MIALRAALPLLIGLLVATSASTGPGDLYQVGEEAVWVFEQKEVRIGDNWFRYDGIVDLFGTPAHLFQSRVRLGGPALGGLEQRFQAQLWLDNHGVAVRHVLEVQIGAQYSRVELYPSPSSDDGSGGWSAIVVQEPGRREISIDVPADAALQVNNFIGYFEVMLALDPPTQDSPFERTLLSSNALRSFPYKATWKERDAATGAAVLQDTLGETLWLSPEGRLVKLEMAAQNLVIRRDENASVEPFDIEAPPPPAKSDLPTEEVSIRYGEVELAGSVTTPPGSSGKLPAVLFISGSGLQDRNGVSSGIDLGTHEILDRLTEEGFLVLRMDDRGAGASTGPLDDLALDDLIADARAALNFLRQHERVDTERIALIGHSEGGTTAPILAAEPPGVAAVVLMAATGRPLSDVIYEQNIRALAKAEMTPEERAETLEQVRHWLDRVITDQAIDPGEVPADFRSLLTIRAWLQSHARQDPIANLQRVEAPVLPLQGAMDFQVSLERDAKVLEAALEEIDHPDFELVSFADLDHLFKKTIGETSGRYRHRGRAGLKGSRGSGDQAFEHDRDVERGHGDEVRSASDRIGTAEDREGTLDDRPPQIAFGLWVVAQEHLCLTDLKGPCRRGRIALEGLAIVLRRLARRTWARTKSGSRSRACSNSRIASIPVALSDSRYRS